jgi:hypothetical protein
MLLLPKSNKRKESALRLFCVHTNGDTQKNKGILSKTRIFYFYKKLAIEKLVLDEVDQVGFVADTQKEAFFGITSNFDKSKTFFVNGIEEIKLDLTKE